jgi:hypothetical protein
MIPLIRRISRKPPNNNRWVAPYLYHLRTVPQVLPQGQVLGLGQVLEKVLQQLVGLLPLLGLLMQLLQGSSF